MYTHGDATYSLSLTCVQKAEHSEHYPDRLLCLTLVIRDDAVNGEGVCAQLLRLSALQRCRRCILAALVRLSQCSAGLRLGTPAKAARRCTRVQQAQALPVVTPTRQAPSEAKDHSWVFSGHLFSVTSLSVLAYRLLIQLSFQSKVTSRCSRKDGL